MESHPPVPLHYDRARNEGPSVWLTRLAVMFGAYPVFTMLMLYATWLLAWGILGHRPEPNVDDPKSISPVVTIVHNATMLLMMGGTAALLFSAVFAAADLYARIAHGRRVRAVHVAAGLAVVCAWVGTIALLRWDPGLVGYWFMD